MSIKYFAYITNVHLSILVKTNGELREEACFTNPGFAKQGMAIYFARKNNPPIYVITNLIEEKFSLDTIPHLGYKDRDALLKRKCKQLYPTARFVKYSYRGRLKTDKNKGQVQFSVINDEPIISDWLALLYELKVPIAGLISLPIWLEQYAKKLSGGTHKLVVSLTGYTHGLMVRQYYFNNNRLALSRARYFNEKDSAASPAEIKEEINLTWRFLTRQFNLSESASTPLVGHLFFSDNDLLRQFKQDDFSAIEVNFYTISELALTKKITLPEGSGLAQWVIHQSLPKGHYQDAPSRFYFRHHQLKRGLNISGLIILLSSLIYTGITGNALISHEQTIYHLSNEQAALDQSLAETMDAPLTEGFNAIEMQSWLAEHRKVAQASVKPDLFLIPISRVLADFKAISLIRLNWHTVTTDSVKAVAIELVGNLNQFDGNYRAALNTIDLFRQALEAITGVEHIESLTLPVELLADKEVSGSSNNLPDSVSFSLLITWKLA